MRQLRKLVLLLTLPACFDFTAEPFGEKGLHCDIGSKCDPGLVCDANDYCVDRCDEVRCGDHGGCKHNPDGSAFCSCDSGYVSTAEPKCVPVGSKDAPCGPSAICDLGLTCSGDICVDACAQLNCGEHGACALQDNVARCNCDSGYKEVQGTCMDNCTDVSCSGHGACMLSGGEPTCDCESGYEASGLNCVVPSCVPASHAAQHCDSGSLYWYDSCGAREGIAASCGTRGCANDSCVAPVLYGLGGSLNGIFTTNTPNQDLAMHANGNPSLAWVSGGNQVARWTGSTWIQFSGAVPNTGGVALGLDPSGAPYVSRNAAAEYNGSDYRQLFVSRWNAAWESVGSTPEGLDEVFAFPFATSLAIAPTGQPYIAWATSGVWLKTFNGTSWVELGGSGTGRGLSGNAGRDALKTKVRINSSNQPVVMWVGRTPGGSTSFAGVYVARWTGTAWEGFAGSNAGLGMATSGDADFDLDGDVPVVAYNTGNGVAVKRWSGTAWINSISGVDDDVALITTSSPRSTVLAVARNGVYLVSYQQGSSGNYAVMGNFYEDGHWLPLGTGQLSTSPAETIFGLRAAGAAGRACVAWRQGSPTSAYIACAKF